MRSLATVLLLTAPTMSLSAQTQTNTLAALRDHARPLLIFAGANDARAEQQYGDVTNHARQAMERDIRVVMLTPMTILRDGPVSPEAHVSTEEQTRLRRRFHIAPDDFTVILIGKDGGEKLRSSTPIPWNKLAVTIDAMPMRQAEMQSR